MKENMTRKHEALYVFRRVAVLALILFLLNGYNLTPSQAVRQNEQFRSLPDTELLHSETVLLTPVDLYHVSLSRVDDTLLLTPARFSLLQGWQPDERSPVVSDTAAEPGIHYWGRKRGNQGLLVIFGVIPESDPIPTFTVEQYSNEWDLTTKYWKLYSTQEITPTVLIEDEGGSYFVCVCKYPAPEGSSAPRRIYVNGKQVGDNEIKIW